MIQFKLPDLGEGVQEGEITKWLVKAGDPVREDQSLLEVMTDKVTAEIPSPYDGVVIDLLAPEGAVVPVGTPLLTIDEVVEEETPAADRRRAADRPPPGASARAAGGRPAAGASPATDGGQSTTAGSPPPTPADRIRAVPLVRKLARDLEVDLSTVSGTGPAGRITEADVRAKAALGSIGRPPARRSALGPDEGADQRSDERVAPRPGRAPSPEHGPAGRLSREIERRAPERSDEPVPLRGLRRRIAERMVEALRVSAPVTYVDEADMSALVALREKARATAERQGVKLTFLPFILKAAAAALREHPKLNAVMDNEKGEILLKKQYHLGVACETDEGLLVPVIRDVDRKTLFDLAREIEAVVDRARAGKLDRADLQGGTFTVTSLGSLGGLFATPILNLPEVAILGVHKISKRPVVRDDQIVAREMAHLSLTFDHRALDGRDAARFVNTLIGYLEDPNLLLLT
jgi:pyruvate dehydrogenase E2 component (dihydrolipoamide acetyltransferase)